MYVEKRIQISEKEKKKPLVLNVSCCNRIPTKKRSALLAPPLLSVSGAGEPPEPLTCPPRRVHSAPLLRMRYSLKGYTVMALASWSYRGISGRECSVAGSRLTFRQVRWVCRLRLSGPLSVDATGGAAPLRSVSFSACAERATCQVSGLNSSNFQCCAEIEKSPYPPVAVGPTRRTDQEQAEGERCLTILPSFAASTDGSRWVFFFFNPFARYQVTEGQRDEFTVKWSGDISRIAVSTANKIPPRCPLWGLARFKMMWMGRKTLAVCVCGPSTTPLRGR